MADETDGPARPRQTDGPGGPGGRDGRGTQDGRGGREGGPGEPGGGPGVLVPGTEVVVRLVKHPRPEVSYPAEVAADDGTHIVVRAPWAGPPSRDLGFTRFEAGDLFTEHYWRDRWYSIKEVRGPGGALKGWYCDVTRPATVRPGELLVHDLDLDLWRSADGRTVLRLDEDEFAAGGLAEREPAAAERARRALDELEELARDGFRAVLGHNGAA